MERRTFLAGAGAVLLAAPLAAEGQETGKVYRLGILTPAAPPVASDRTPATVMIPEALRELGYLEGRNIVIERRFAAGERERLPALARELVQLRVDVIVAIGGTSGAAADATKTIPIVLMGADPLSSGVASLARPGGNVTGVVISEGGLGDKRLQLLREAIPRATRIAVLATTEPAMKGQWQEVKKAADVLRLAPILVEVADSGYDHAFSKMVGERAAGILVLASAVLHRDRKTIIALAAKHRMPAIYQWREHAEDGGLMSYGSSLVSLTRRVAAYVDRLFKGAKPTDLPVEQPTTYELVINLKTAKELGLTIPPSLLGRADELIQ